MATVTEPTQHVTPDAPRQLTSREIFADLHKSAEMLPAADLQRISEGKRIRDIIRGVRAILEEGDRLGGAARRDWIHLLTDDDRNALRFLRRQLIERDLYEQLYGDLPFTVTDDGEVQS